MSILCDKEILKLCQEQQMITPYADKSIKTGYKDLNHETRFTDADEYKIISYGLSSYGYDLSLADEFKVFTDKLLWDEQPIYSLTFNGAKKRDIHKLVETEIMGLIDPKNMSEDYSYKESGNGYCIIPPNSFALGRSNEYIKMPRDITGLATNKSTYARCGLNTPSTVLEAGWEGHLTIEMFNSTPRPIKVYANEGIIQILFFKGEDCLTSYSDRGGKYQGQTGVTGAKV